MVRLKSYRFSLLVVGSCLLVIAGTSQVANRYLSADKRTNKQTDCQRPGKRHVVTITNGMFMPNAVDARLCDRLSIKNLDPYLRLIGFGEHDAHQAYNGITQYSLANGQSLTINLVKLGSFKFHDHFNDNVVGTFSVSN